MLAANRRVFCRYPIFTIAVVHDLSQYHVPVKYDKFRMFYIKKVLPHYVRKAQSIVAISQSTKNDLIKYWHIPEEKISVVYNGFTPPEKVAAEKKKQILYISLGFRILQNSCYIKENNTFLVDRCKEVRNTIKIRRNNNQR